jgi:GT2 family glycosyltransferase
VRELRPPLSVLMPAHNGERFLRQAVASVLAQTYEAFELIVVDDASTDQTAEILASFDDPRLRILRNSKNLGIVGSLNRAMSAAAGRYIARMDADDLCVPTRFARQVAFLEQHADVTLVGSNKFILSGGQVRDDSRAIDDDPELLRCLFYFSNPVAHPTMMFRAEIVSKLGTYLNPDMQYAEDFDFSHRVLALGKLAILPERLLIYRQHELNLTRTRREEMVTRTARVLNRVYSPLLGVEAEAAGTLISNHLFAGTTVVDGPTLKRLGGVMDRLMRGLANQNGLHDAQIERLTGHIGAIWWRTIQHALGSGALGAVARHHNDFPLAARSRPRLSQIALSGLSGAIPGKRALRRYRPKPSDREYVPPHGRSLDLGGVSYVAEAVAHTDPPSLYIVVDTEAEFDWNGDFDRSLTAVASIDRQESAQAIFDSYGVRPIYVVDYAVASQPEGYLPLRRILDRHGCAIGAHLHPWVNPPFEEEVSAYNSFGGNLPASLEERKLKALTAMIERNFGVAPLFFKAGRYGVGPETMQTLARLGFAVDFSILPGADLRRRGGPDFRYAGASPYRASVEGVLSVPMTRGQIGLLPTLPSPLRALLDSSILRRLRVPGLLSHSGLANIVTLTPEGVTAKEQGKLLRSFIARGHRTFTLHYHSPSLAAGNTPYVRSAADLKEFLRRIEEVCRLFFDELGGLPGNPADLLPSPLRGRIWPTAASIDAATAIEAAS